MTRRALHADLDRCTGCRACVVACADANGLSADTAFVRLLQIGPEGEFPDLNMYYLPLACQQCQRPACANACAEAAIGYIDDGLVKVDPARCTGCGECVGACPYGAILLDSVGDVARKCELCSDIVPGGTSPVCVAACPAKALRVVDLDDIQETDPGEGRPSLMLRVDAGTEPVGRFVLARQRWRDLC